VVEKFHVRQEFGPTQASKRSAFIQYKDGEDATERFRPGRQKPGVIKITRDFSSTKEFYNWRRSVFEVDNDAGDNEALRINPDDSWNFTQAGYRQHQNKGGSGHTGGMSGNHKDIME